MAEQLQLRLKGGSLMARLNDNLFTTLAAHALPREMGCCLLSRFGWLRVRFSADGLAEMFFDDGVPVNEGVDSVFREAFLQWLAQFERMEPLARWRYLDLKGTEFQQSVWRRLLEIPFGATTSYGQIAADLGRPQSSRAVGSAVGANPLSLLVPCHRVLPRAGGTGHYRWGADRKRALLDAEQESGSDLCVLLQ